MSMLMFMLVVVAMNGPERKPAMQQRHQQQEHARPEDERRVARMNVEGQRAAVGAGRRLPTLAARGEPPYASAKSDLLDAASTARLPSVDAQTAGHSPQAGKTP